MAINGSIHKLPATKSLPHSCTRVCRILFCQWERCSLRPAGSSFVDRKRKTRFGKQAWHAKKWKSISTFRRYWWSFLWKSFPNSTPFSRFPGSQVIPHITPSQIRRRFCGFHRFHRFRSQWLIVMYFLFTVTESLRHLTWFPFNHKDFAALNGFQLSFSLLKLYQPFLDVSRCVMDTKSMS